MQEIGAGHLRKMQVQLAEGQAPVRYQLSLDEQSHGLNDWLGKQIRLEHLGEIHCLHCGRKAKKSFNQGYCYPCFTRLACCDSCIVSPEKCHYDAGTCREEDWAQQHCMTDHIVYLANSSGLKVGITRSSQIPTRWIDQGASQALPIFRVQNRKLSGLTEVIFKQYVADKTNWRAMLKGKVDELDLVAHRDELFALTSADISALQSEYGLQSVQPLPDAESVSISYPVLEYPTKVSSFNLDKDPVVEGRLMGVKGQYLILDTGVINIRKFTSYRVSLAVAA